MSILAQRPVTVALGDRRDHPGTAPGDRAFRPDVEGLRALAVLAVVLFHAGIPGVSGGYVGVDVFFVISGFVITGLLLRERTATRRTSLAAFYARRVRRILPAASLVIVATVLAARVVLGAAQVGAVAGDGRWAAVFLANFHFSAAGANYLSARQPPSPLQNFWSLAVEEQFYIVYPTIFLVVAGLRTRLSLRQRMAVFLSLVVAASLVLSVVQTASSPQAAYFSPFTRAWELALGGLVAVSTQWLLRLPRRTAIALTWAGLAMVVASVFIFGPTTAYPGAWVALPVVGTAVVIAGGVRMPLGGAESLLALPPLRRLGRLSYSLYLWHWPVLQIAAQRSGKSSLGPLRNSLLLVLAGLLSLATYRFLEDPVRHAAALRRSAPRSIGLGVALSAVTLGLVTLGGGAGIASASPSTTGRAPVPALTADSLGKLVASSVGRRDLPRDLSPPLAALQGDFGGPPPQSGCWPGLGRTSVPACVFGDPRGTHTAVLYGDSHAAMWFDAIDDIATQAHWRLVVLTKGACGAALLHYANPYGWHKGLGEFAECDVWHTFALHRISSLRPSLVILSQSVGPAPGPKAFSTSQWQSGLEATLRRIVTGHTKAVVLSDIPPSTQMLANFFPACLSDNPTRIDLCGTTSPVDGGDYRWAASRAARAFGARYVNVVPWLCSRFVCPAVIGHYAVYNDPWHVSATYTRVLEPVLAQAIGLDRLSLK